ncbi:hypothetical protein ES703_58712 [subsurface metagenome]
MLITGGGAPCGAGGMTIDGGGGAGAGLGAGAGAGAGAGGALAQETGTSSNMTSTSPNITVSFFMVTSYILSLSQSWLAFHP